MSKDQLITQREITHVLNHPEHKKTGSIFKKILNEISLMLFVFVISFSIINWPAISTKLKYWWRVDYHNATYKPTKQSASQTFPNNRIIIQKIGVDAPIIWNIEASKIHSELSNGVVHYKGTAQAGETGNVFFSGHSSDFIWAKGDYKNVFALLDKLVAGDIITITQNNKTYTYKVNNAFIVKPTETKVLEPTPSPILTLMTCYPVGTANKRLIVTAALISSPSPSNSSFNLKIDRLPASR